MIAIEIPLNQLLKVGPFIFNLIVNFCQLLVANLNSHDNEDGCQPAAIHAFWPNRCCRTLLIAQPSRTLCHPWYLQECNFAERFFGSIVTFSENRNRVVVRPQSLCAQCEHKLERLCQLLLYLLYITRQPHVPCGSQLPVYIIIVYCYFSRKRQ